MVPQDGQDEEYDRIQEEITTLEDELNKELKRLEKKVGYVGSMAFLLFYIQTIS